MGLPWRYTTRNIDLLDFPTPDTWWKRIPIHLWHLPDPLDIKWHLVTLKPGVHYAWTYYNHLPLLREEIPHLFNNSFRQEETPAGYKRGRINRMLEGPLSNNYPEGVRDLLYEVGINPIRAKPEHGYLFLWGDLFIAKEGTIETMWKQNPFNPRLLNHPRLLNPKLKEF